MIQTEETETTADAHAAIIAEVKEAQESVADQIRARRAIAEENYRKLIRRAAAGESMTGDAASLSVLMTELEIKLPEVERHIAAMAEFIHVEQTMPRERAVSSLMDEATKVAGEC